MGSCPGRSTSLASYHSTSNHVSSCQSHCTGSVGALMQFAHEIVNGVPTYFVTTLCSRITHTSVVFSHGVAPRLAASLGAALAVAAASANDKEHRTFLIEASIRLVSIPWISSC
jgi:hypothetical protein